MSKSISQCHYCVVDQKLKACCSGIAGVTIHTVKPDTWRADYLFVESVGEPTTKAFCESAFEVSAGQKGVIRASRCTPLRDLFFDLYQSGDPLNVSGIELQRRGIHTMQCSKLHSSCVDSRHDTKISVPDVRCDVDAYC